MLVTRDIDSFRDARRALDGSVAFVPTMGALHRGHLSLFQAGRERADHLVVSIFVNPTQFDRASDLESYPRDEERDLRLCREEGAEIIFMPPPGEMYANGKDQSTEVLVHDLTDGMCGRTRPGHFDGVATVVSKLFNIVQPDFAVFGQKDYQQLAVIKRMTRDLNFPVEIIGAKTQRELDGLATSSRNLNLTPEWRQKGLALSRGLRAAWTAYQDGERDAATLERMAHDAMVEVGIRVDYTECVHPVSLERLQTVGEDGGVLAIAGFAGNVRLIDNIRLDGDLPEELAADQ